jgi:hypothetical protein
MARQHAEIALGAGHYDHVDHFREHHALGRHQFEVHLVRHL